MSGDRNIIGAREYSRDCAVFRKPNYLKVAVDHYTSRILGQERPLAKIECDPRVFDATSKLLDKQPLDTSITTDDIVNILRL